MAYLDHVLGLKTANPAHWTEQEFNEAAALLAKACGHTGTQEAVRLLKVKSRRCSLKGPIRSVEKE